MLFIGVTSIAQETITFPSKDGLTITADWYAAKEASDAILLCHQAGYSRGEYLNTAKALNDLGYDCLAIDQRSGNTVNNIKNKTAALAKEKGLATNYTDAKKDIETAIDYLYLKNNNQPIILVGSSYSASLVLLIGKNNSKVKAVAAFSPGEYLKGYNVTKEITGYAKPIFVTSSKNETAKVEDLLAGISAPFLLHYKPTEQGIHGSRALWKTTDGVDGYWNAFKAFLTKIKIDR